MILNYTSYSQTPKYSNEFLNLGVGARAMAMANSNVALTNDASSTYWNPAGLRSIDSNKMQVYLMHSSYFAGIADYDFGGVVFRLNNGDNIAISMIRFGIDDIPNTIHLIDESGLPDYDRITSFSAVDYAFYGSYARSSIDKKFHYGFNAKIIYKQVGSFANAWGFGFDVGFKYRKDNFILGVMARDVTTTYNLWTFHYTDDEIDVFTITGNTVSISSTEITLPKFLIGLGHSINISEKIDFRYELDFDITLDGKRNTLISSDPFSIDPHFGLELAFFDISSIRVGIRNIQQEMNLDAGNFESHYTVLPSFGIGLKIKDLTLDYAFTNLFSNSSTLNSHFISLYFNLESFANSNE